MSFLVATNVVVSRPPERRLTKMTYTCAENEHGLNSFTWKLLMTPHLDRHRKTLNRKYYQLSKLEIEYEVMKEMYAALNKRSKTTF